LYGFLHFILRGPIFHKPLIMKYLIILFSLLFLGKTNAQQPRFVLPKNYDSTLTQVEKDSFQRGLVPYVLEIRFEKFRREYIQKRDSFLRKADGMPVPNFEARDTSGLMHRPSQYLGRVLILHFWNFWEYSFQNEIPKLNEIAEKYLKDGVEILSFTDVTLGDSEKKVLEKTPIYFPLIENAYKFSAELLEIRLNRPYLILVDKYGRMRFFMTEDKLTNVRSNVNENVINTAKKPINYPLEDKILQLLKE
jgi:thiol-disulfide isomerase/thioredoxin